MLTNIILRLIYEKNYISLNKYVRHLCYVYNYFILVESVISKNIYFLVQNQRYILWRWFGWTKWINIHHFIRGGHITTMHNDFDIYTLSSWWCWICVRFHLKVLKFWIYNLNKAEYNSIWVYAVWNLIKTRWIYS